MTRPALTLRPDVLALQPPEVRAALAAKPRRAPRPAAAPVVPSARVEPDGAVTLRRASASGALRLGAAQRFVDGVADPRRERPLRAGAIGVQACEHHADALNAVVVDADHRPANGLSALRRLRRLRCDPRSRHGLNLPPEHTASTAECFGIPRLSRMPKRGNLTKEREFAVFAASQFVNCRPVGEPP